MVLSRYNLELAATAASIAAGCIPCTHYHIIEVRKFGAEDQDIQLALAAGAKVADETVKAMARKFCPDAISTGDQNGSQEDEGKVKFEILCIVGAAVAVNSISHLKKSIKLARINDITDDEILEVIALSRQIKVKASSHLVKIANQLNADPEQAKAIEQLCT